MTRPHLEALVAVLFLGTVPVTIRAIDANPWVIGLVRLGIATLLAAALLRDSRCFHRLDRRQLLAVMGIGLVFAVHWATYFVSIKMSSASVAAIGAATFGVHVAVLGRLFLGQAPSRLQWLSLAIGFGGTLLVMGEFSWREDMARGFLLSIFSALLYSLLPILHQRNAAIPVNLRTLGQYGFALPVFLAFIPRMDWHLAGPDWWGLAHLGVLGTFVAHSLWIRATTVLPTCESGIIYYLYVPIAMLLAWIFLGEPWVTTRVVGAGLIIFASCLGVFSQSRRRS